MARSLNLDQFIALNDELAALARSGIPLHVGLKALGQDMPGQLGRTASEVARRLEKGEVLEEVVADPNLKLPGFYTAMVQSGARSGAIAESLETVSAAARRVGEMRRNMRSVTLYPLSALVLAVLVVFWLVWAWLPESRSWMDSISQEGQVDMGFWQSIQPWLPGMLIGVSLTTLFVMLGLVVSGRMPFVRRAKLNAKWGVFADILDILLRHDVPLTEGLVIAGKCSGDRKLAASCERLAQRLDRGEPIRAGGEVIDQFPPLIRWSILHSANRSPTEEGGPLANTARVCRRRSEYATYLATVYGPLLLVVVGGGTLLSMLVILVFWPWYETLMRFSNEVTI